MGFRAALHQAGAAALTQLLQWPEPAADRRTVPCSCGQPAQYRELRAKTILTSIEVSQIGLAAMQGLRRHAQS